MSHFNENKHSKNNKPESLEEDDYQKDSRKNNKHSSKINKKNGSKEKLKRNDYRYQ